MKPRRLVTIAISSLVLLLVVPTAVPRSAAKGDSITVMGKVCVSDRFGVAVGGGTDGNSIECFGPAEGIEVVLNEEHKATTGSDGRFSIAPISRAELNACSLQAGSSEFGWFEGVPIAAFLGSRRPGPATLDLILSVPDGSADWIEFATVEQRYAGTGEGPWEVGGKPLQQFLQPLVDQLDLTDLAGRRWSAADLKGKVTVLAFMSTSCAPCGRELPLWTQAQRELREAGLQVIGIADEGDRPPMMLSTWLEQRAVAWPVGQSTPLHERFAVPRLPTNVVVGKDGKVIGVQLRGRAILPVLTRLTRG